MAGLGIKDLPNPKRGLRPAKDAPFVEGQPRFETVADSLREDARRAVLIKRSIARYPELFGDEANDLVTRLERGVQTRAAPRTPASSLYMRRMRNRIGGALWALAEDEALAPAVTATLRPTGMWVPAGELKDLNPRSLMRRLEADCYRSDINDAEGYLFAGLHSEFDIRRGGYDFHYHLVAGGEKAEAIDSLRLKRKYSAPRNAEWEQGLPESPRIVRSREPLYNLPAPLNYVVQSMHPHRPTTVQPDGSVQRGERRRRIPEPYHTDWLMWMDRWSISDMTLLVGMRVGTGGFIITDSSVYG